ncbi:hypothetical protein P9281_02540 [Caballeronia sp. LP003]|uniref:hypothetical protein n=1 Tax=Caballeronia sp. LP003 TaxID=3038551 RepID=UPI0028606266|nr:hypothetical protein [Caballeronia sp. LP003]
MSQPRGPHAGYRGKSNNRSQPQHPASSSRPVRVQPPFKASDSAPAQASIIKTRSLKFLVDAVGAENIALGLDSSLTRIAELLRGERFTPETAFHMETALRLPSGFFDQHHPALAPEVIARLKSPLEFVRVDEASDEGDAEETSLLPNNQKPSLPASSLSEEAKMRSKSSKGAPAAVKARSAETPKHAGGRPSIVGGASNQNGPRQAAQRERAHSDGAATVEGIRRANLHVLTGRNGSKVKLGAVMGLTGSNMAHRLHGKKRMDDVEVQRFTERLGLPEGWLDTPRSETDIPESVVLLLAPASRARGHSLALPASAAAPNDDTRDAAAPANESDVVLSSTSSDAQAAASPTDAPGGQGGVIGREEHELNEAVAAPADEHVDADESKVADAVAQPAESPLAPAAPPRTAAPAITTLQTRLDGLDGIAPIAEALLKTLAGKARTGRLDELKALELLQQAVLL